MDPAFVPPSILCFGMGCLVYLIILCVLSFIFRKYYYYIFVLKHCSSCFVLFCEFDSVVVAFNRCCRGFFVCCCQNYMSLGVLYFLGLLGFCCQYIYCQLYLIQDFLRQHVFLIQPSPSIVAAGDFLAASNNICSLIFCTSPIEVSNSGISSVTYLCFRTLGVFSLNCLMPHQKFMLKLIDR